MQGIPTAVAAPSLGKTSFHALRTKSPTCFASGMPKYKFWVSFFFVLFLEGKSEFFFFSVAKGKIETFRCKDTILHARTELEVNWEVRMEDTENLKMF